MITQSSALTRVIQLIDALNKKDPNHELIDGEKKPKEWLYSDRMSTTLNEYVKDPSDHLQIAARAQHIERWKRPRENYPLGRQGYKRWRSELALFHAERTAELMQKCGFEEPDIDRVKFLIQKRKLRSDSETQALEDVICLVFIKYYLADFAAKHENEKVLDILRKTWKKISPSGRAAVLKLEVESEVKKMLNDALS